MTMNINLSGAQIGKDIIGFNYCFVDTLLNNPNY